MAAGSFFTAYPGVVTKGFNQTVHTEMGFSNRKNQMNVKTGGNIYIMPDLGPIKSNGPVYSRKPASAGQVPDRRRTGTESHQGHPAFLMGQPVRNSTAVGLNVRVGFKIIIGGLFLSEKTAAAVWIGVIGINDLNPAGFGLSGPGAGGQRPCQPVQGRGVAENIRGDEKGVSQSYNIKDSEASEATVSTFMPSLK